MCGRYVLYGSVSALARQAGIELEGEVPGLAPRYNVAPSQSMPIVVAGPDRVLGARWGFVPGWVREAPKLRPINARIEAVFEKPYFRSALRTHRCLVPADAWYEWRVLDGAKQPYAISLGEPCFFAGLWADSPHTGGPNYTILTGPAHPAIHAIHDRMPMALAPARAAAWLHPQVHEAAWWRDWLAQASADVAPRAWPVSRAVNTPRNDVARLLDPVPDPTRGEPP